MIKRVREKRFQHKYEVDEDAISDANNWEKYLPGLIEDLQSTRYESHISSMKTLKHILGTVFPGAEALEPYLDDLTTSLTEIINNYTVPEEHQIACDTFCIVALSAGEDFELYASTLLAEITPSLHQLTEEEKDRLFLIGFIGAFIIHTSITKQDIINSLTGFLLGKGEFSDEVMVKGLHSLSILMSSVDIEIFEHNYDKIIRIINEQLNSSTYEVLCAVLELIAVTFDYLRELDDVPASDADEEPHNASDFVNEYRQKVTGISRGLKLKKTDQKSLQKKATHVDSLFDGEEIVTEDLILNQQSVVFEGKRKLTLLKALREVSTVHFECQMARNPVVHEFFAYRLRSTDEVAREKKRNAWQNKRDRVANTKDRERDRDKKRKQKEMRAESDF
ncbi:hypothetical protein TRFO_24644 [Tritrichomonas foetus]|uniref:Interferon-related developmental regulator N-terminal domain-containing protein n=1 Tax=Tritrichomonas foetus TaxID=1144522 RepID=A0A1J4K6Z0_9EUKA|nr:hypothetical protein TRFO_24644 [Tritrichomonas foetus]|eukprot:OHT07241.1 hypothetical protein TRFO_24644 [Tritrichomonas foetus]